MPSLLPSDLAQGVDNVLFSNPLQDRARRQQIMASEAGMLAAQKQRQRQQEAFEARQAAAGSLPEVFRPLFAHEPKTAMDMHAATVEADKSKQLQDTLTGFFKEQNAFGPTPLPQQNPFFQQLLAQAPAQAKTVAELYTPEKPQDTRPADVKEYEFYSQQEAGAGRSPASFNEWRLQRAKASAPVTNVSTSVGGQKVPDNVINASLKALEESNAMEEQVQDITNFLRLSEVTPTGFTSPMTLPVKALLEDFGWKVDDKVPAQQALKGFQNQYALKLRNPESGFGLTGNTSDRDVKFLKDAVAGLEKTPAANKAILTTLLAKQRRERDLKSLYAQHLSSGEPIGDWVKKRKAFIESNPFFTPEEEAFFKSAKMMKTPTGGIKKSQNDRTVADEVWGD